MLAERQNLFQQKLPLLEQSSSLDKLEDYRTLRNNFAAQLDNIEANEDYQSLATVEEKESLERLAKVIGSMKGETVCLPVTVLYEGHMADCHSEAIACSTLSLEISSRFGAFMTIPCRLANHLDWDISPCRRRVPPCACIQAVLTL